MPASCSAVPGQPLRRQKGARRVFRAGLVADRAGLRRARPSGGMGLAAEGIRAHHRLPDQRIRGELLPRRCGTATQPAASSTRAMPTAEHPRRSRRCWPQTEIAKAWIAQVECRRGGGRAEARAALVRLQQHYLRIRSRAAGTTSSTARAARSVEPSRRRRSIMCSAPSPKPRRYWRDSFLLLTRRWEESVVSATAALFFS